MCIGVTGHRASHSSFPAETGALDAALNQIFANVDEELERSKQAATIPGQSHVRLHTLLSDGADHHAAQCGLDRGWSLVAPLPFGRALNAAINADPATAADAKSILIKQPASDVGTAARLARLNAFTDQAAVFELADDDERLTKLFLASLDDPSDAAVSMQFASETGKRAALAGRILIEQSDLIVAIWDGATTANIGGTGHTAQAAVKAGTPVLWIDPAEPENWRIVRTPEDLAAHGKVQKTDEALDELRTIVNGAVAIAAAGQGSEHTDISTLNSEHWRDRSLIRSHAFRRVEALFGQKQWRRKLASMRQVYERPDAIAEGSGNDLIEKVRNLSSGGNAIADRIATQILPRFAWLDGISAILSDRHRSGMTLNFVLGACAIIGGILYLPLVDPAQKWIFASIELLFLLAILLNTSLGQKLRVHGRWFETRRAAEYLRYSPMLAIMGVARPVRDWPHGTASWWPEWYVRHTVRTVGLPDVTVDKAYLRSALRLLRDEHVEPQRGYHRAKAERLSRAHHGLDALSEKLFISAVFVVALYLILAGLAAFSIIDMARLNASAKWFTVLAVAMPTLGGALAGIRYFGDFERFAEISEVTAEKLDHVAARIDVLLNAEERAMNYGRASEIMRATDDIVFAEIQSWQSVFSRKVIAVPA